MNRSHLFSLLVFLFFSMIALPNIRSQVMDYTHKFEKVRIGKEETVDVPQEKIAEWHRKVSNPVRSGGAKTPSMERVKELAREFGLMEKTATNPRLVFLDSDIVDWYQRKLNESRLMLEFAARRFVLEEADAHGIKLSKKMLSENAQQVIPIIEKEQRSLLINTLCEGNSSEEFVSQSWDGLKKRDYEKALACTENAIKKWSRQADVQQTKAANSGCSDPPPPTELKPYFASYWALSDIATSWFIRGEVFYQQRKWAEAKEAYKTVIDKYHCAFTWNANNFFWRPAEAAQDKYDEIRLK